MEKRCFNCKEKFDVKDMIYENDILQTYFCSVDCLQGRIEKNKFSIKKCNELIKNTSKASDLDETIKVYLNKSKESEEFYKIAIWLIELKEFRQIANTNSLLFDRMYTKIEKEI